MIERKPVAGTWETTQKNWSFLRLYYLYIDLKFSNIESFLIKVGPSGIPTYDLVNTVHTL